jgi:hypothetical protein
MYEMFVDTERVPTLEPVITEQKCSLHAAK